MKNHQRVLWITQTAVMTALLITLQWVTVGTSAFAGQYITGSCVNAVLAVTTLLCGMWSGITVAVLSPFFAFFLGIGPKLIQIVPAVAIGNFVFVVLLHLLIGERKYYFIWKILTVVFCAVVKFAVLYLLVAKLLVPLLMLPDKQALMLGTMFSYPQMITAAIGGLLAIMIVPILKKAVRH